MVTFSRIFGSASVGITLAACAFSAFLPSTSGQVVTDVTTYNALVSVVNSNNSRMDNQRIASAFIYLFVALGMFFLASEMAVLLGWLFQPLNLCLRRNPKNSEAALAKWNGLMWWWLCICILFVVSGACGLPGWIVVCCFEAFICLCIYVVLIAVHCCGSSSAAPVPAKVEYSAGVGRNVAEEDPTLIKETRVAFDAPSAAPIPASADTRVTWSRCPQRIGSTQAALVIIFCLIVCICCLSAVILMYAWTIPEYRLWNIHTGTPTPEFIPQSNAKALALLYAWDGSVATHFHVQIFNKLFSNWCGEHYTKTLDANQKKELIYDDWISKYNIDMNLFTPTDYNFYTSVNDFFMRKMNFTIPIRPIDYSAGNVISPCECRVLVYNAIQSAAVWVKGDHYSVSDLLDGRTQWVNYFTNGYFFVGRLSPQDYHRFNSPIDGTLVGYYEVSGELWDLSAVAARSENKVFTNQRKVIILQTAGGHKVAVIAIGSACVGSVVVPFPLIGRTVSRGDELGYFQFGGSTVVMLFEPNAVSFTNPLVQYSLFPVETFVHINYAIGNNTLG